MFWGGRGRRSVRLVVSRTATTATTTARATILPLAVRASASTPTPTFQPPLHTLRNRNTTTPYNNCAWYSSTNVTSGRENSFNNNDYGDDFVVSILGPPNAGKSTLFNRLQCKERNKTYRLGSHQRRGAGGNRNRTRGGGRISSKRVSRGDAIVSPVAGTTRDRRECWGRIGGTGFVLMDTAGVDGDRIRALVSPSGGGKADSGGSDNDAHRHDDGPAMERAMMEQTLEAAKQSDLVLLLWDARVGVTQDLMATARWLRKLGKIASSTTDDADADDDGSSNNVSNVVVVANKLEGDSWAQNEDSPVLEHLHDVLRLGLGEAIPISALQGDGMADIAILIEQLKAEKRKRKQKQHEDDHVDETETIHAENKDGDNDTNDSKPLQIAIIGRQNVGKSTLVNTLVQDNRVLAGPTPGLTRDAIAVEWYWEHQGRQQDGQDKAQQQQQQLVRLVDTAGIRKLAKRSTKDDAIEDMAVADALRAMKVAEVAVLVLDAEELYVQRQELALCSAVLDEGRSLVIAANKMDLLEMSAEYSPRDFANNVREQIEERIPILRNIPVVPISGLTGKGVSELLPTVLDARNRWSRTIATGLLNRWLAEVVTGSRPPVVNGVRAKLKYIIQTKGRPPTFIIFSNVDGKFPDPYLRYLTKHFQDSFGFFGMPVRLVVKSSSKGKNPYKDSSGKKKRGGFGIGGRKARFERRIKEFKEKSRKSKRSEQKR